MLASHLNFRSFGINAKEPVQSFVSRRWRCASYMGSPSHRFEHGNSFALNIYDTPVGKCCDAVLGRRRRLIGMGIV